MAGSRQAAAETGTQKYLVYGGKSGWLGQQLVSLLKAKGTEVIVGNARIENREDVARYARTCRVRVPQRLWHAGTRVCEALRVHVLTVAAVLS